ncbi:hypothetical protein QFZ52_002925 [Arthrobacter woluwensis]|nr:hypothetical protein [Arthrobacter woluwensis]
MTAHAVQRDAQAVRGGHGRAGREADETGRDRRDVLSQHHIGTRETVQETVAEHLCGAASGLLGGLEDRDERARPLLAGPGQQFGRPEQAGHVHIVAAGVHDGDVVAVRIGPAGGAGVVEAGLLLDGQAVHVRAQQHGGADAVGQDADDAGPAHALRHLEAELTQVPGDDAGGAGLLEGEFRVAVEVLVYGGEIQSHVPRLVALSNHRKRRAGHAATSPAGSPDQRETGGRCRRTSGQPTTTRCAPRPGASISTTSPCLRYSNRPDMATPSGVPVMITSPGSRAMN